MIYTNGIMKIYYIISNKNGLESFIHREMLLTKGAGHDVVALCFFHNKDEHFQLDNIPQYVAIKPKSILLGLIGVVRSVVYYKKLRILRNYLLIAGWNGLIDILIAHYFNRNIDKNSFIQCHFGDRKFFVGTLIKELNTHNKLGITVHAHELYANPNPTLFNSCLLKADRVVTISHLNKKLLLELQPALPPDKIRVIFLSIDLKLFSVNQNKVKVLTVSRFTERKGFHELFEAIKLLSRPNVEFICVGWGNLDLNQLAADYGVKDFVTIFNKMSSKQLRYFYSTCDIFCLPSKATNEEGSEGIPVVLMEAMASQMQIVTTTNGSIPELVDNIVVEENNSTALAEGLLRAIEINYNNQECQRIGLKNREKVLNKFSVLNHKELMDYWTND